MRTPRKKKKLIPKNTPYCYTSTSSFKELSNGKWGFTTKVCPFYSYIKVKDIQVSDRPNWMDDDYVSEFGDREISWCKLVKCDIDDQVKVCGERDNYKY
jgi:hypothetical protein